MTYDVAIIGAGPAGSAAAIEAARAGAKVLLLEKDAFPRHKVCGEFLSPEVAQVLGELGCASILDAAVPMKMARVHTASGRTLDFALSPAGFSLSRRALDDALLHEAVRLGVAFQQTHVTDPASLPAAAVIPAWGRKIRENLPGGFFGFKAHFRGEWPEQVDLHFFDGGYMGISPVEGGSINVCALVEKRLIRDAEAIARRLLGPAPQQEWPFLYTGPLHPGWQGGEGLAAGDAAAFLDPFTGDGISLALRTGRLAARAALRSTGAAPISAGDAATAATPLTVIVVAAYRREVARMCRGQFAAAKLLRFGAHRPWMEAPVARFLDSNPRLRQTLFGITRGKVVD